MRVIAAVAALVILAPALVRCGWLGLFLLLFLIPGDDLKPTRH